MHSRNTMKTSGSQHPSSMIGAWAGISYLRCVKTEWRIIRNLGIRMARRNLQSAYRDSWIGFAWMLIQPFTTSILWILLQEHKIISVNVPGQFYAIFVMTGTICWQAFCDGLLITQRAIHDNKSMLTKINVPPEGLLLAGLTESFIRLSISALISLTVINLYSGKLPEINDTAWVLGPSMALCMGFSAGWLLGPPLLLLPDLLRMLQLFLPFVMYLTPVVYNIPESGILRIFMNLNPLSQIMSATRDILMTDIWNFPKLITAPIVCLWTALLLGGHALRKSMPHIIQEMGS